MRLRGILVAATLACGASRVPASLRGYDILVERQDSLGTELARAFRDQGFRVRRAMRGGNRPTAALVLFAFSPAGSPEPQRLHVRLADTRSGAILAAVAIPLDSLAPHRAQADSAVRALTAPPLPTPP